MACADKKCPWTGLVSIRGRILTGKVVSTKMSRTIIIRREYLHYVPKYNRYERRHSKLPVHVSPAFRGECIRVRWHECVPDNSCLQSTWVTRLSWDSAALCPRRSSSTCSRLPDRQQRSRRRLLESSKRRSWVSVAIGADGIIPAVSIVCHYTFHYVYHGRRCCTTQKYIS